MDDDYIPEASPSTCDEVFNDNDEQPIKKKARISETTPVLPRSSNIIEDFEQSDNEIILKWRARELKTLLQGYIEYMAAGASKTEATDNIGNDHETLVNSYNVLNKIINFISNFLTTHLGLPHDLVKAMRHHSQRIPTNQYFSTPCYICSHEPTYAIQFLGPDYHKTSLKFDILSSSPQKFYLCRQHFYFADIFFTLTHMKLNVHLNLEKWISSTRLTRFSEISADISQPVLTNIAVYYFSIFLRLRSCNHIFNCNARGDPGAIKHFHDTIKSLECKTKSEIE